MNWRWAAVIPASIGLGWLFTWWQVPAAWILAAIIASGTMALATSAELPINDHVYRFGRGVIGILAGLPLAAVPLATLGGLLIPGLLVSFVTLGIGVAGGLLLAKREPSVMPETGILSMLAGGASILPVLAKELGADYRFVALGQYLRLLIVSMSLPLITAFFTAPGGTAAGEQAAGPWYMFLAVLVIALFSERLGRLIRLPAPAILSPMLFTVLISLALPEGWSLQPPEAFRIAAFLVIGWMCGGALSLPALKAFARQLPATLSFIVVVILACAATAYPLHLWLDITYFEAYLATSPGALETVLALSSEGGAGPVVVTLQLLRMLTLLAVAGYLPQIIRLLTRRR
ncbi:AbrB family transcriptional regulator [Corynebacterium sp. YIM 101645]|uniref:AbrB family transcriptional regulator n=1 Tax=Corynebacterium lemuris TaxID=1859292 RepID=A0ABT2FUK9_9CORY|nr:AbrB family transcriptional regulator [Corynebacterium lemuris]MCS5478188.1 AbrB family transcriptional regulator [Corynebacterium lemuris]